MADYALLHFLGSMVSLLVWWVLWMSILSFILHLLFCNHGQEPSDRIMSVSVIVGSLIAFPTYCWLWLRVTIWLGFRRGDLPGLPQLW